MFIASIVAEATYGCSSRPAVFLHHTGYIDSNEKLQTQEQISRELVQFRDMIVDVSERVRELVAQGKRIGICIPGESEWVRKTSRGRRLEFVRTHRARGKHRGGDCTFASMPVHEI